MTCGACVASIEGGLKSQAGVFSVKVALLCVRRLALEGRVEVFRRTDVPLVMITGRNEL